MSTAENGKIKIETGQSLVAFVVMTAAADAKSLTSAASVWSGKSTFAPDIRPNGMVSGFNVVSIAATVANNTVDVAAFTAYSIGILKSVSAAAAITVTRPATNVSKVNSITMTSAGNISVVVGTDGASAAFSETRGASGGPPFILVDSVEVAQVRFTTSAAATVIAAEIFQTVGTHVERFDFPSFTSNNIGLGSNTPIAAQKNAHVLMESALPLSHTADVPKRVYIQYYTATMSDLARTFGFVPVDNSHSVSSTQYYGGTIATASRSLGQGSFTALLTDGVTDNLVTNKDQVLTVQFFPDRNKTPFILTQGAIGLGRTYPFDNQIQAEVTISSEVQSAEFSS